MSRNKQRGVSTILLLIFVVVLTFAAGYFYSERYLETDSGAQADSAQGAQGQLDFPWPPKLDQPFPDITLYSHTGEMLKLSDFKGKVILVEPVGMTCPACNAFSGGGKRGGYQGISPQQKLPPIESLLPRYASGIELGDERLILVQLMLYDMQYKAPTIEESRNWAEHFGLDKKNNVYIMVGDERYINQASYDMIPGFFLIDKDFILRSDSTGHRPKHNLFTELFPKLAVLLQSVEVESPELVTEPSEAQVIKQFSERLYTELGMTVPVDRAYRSIPHKQTTFNSTLAKMNGQDSDYLGKLFSIVDIAIIERVQTLLWHQTGGRRGENNDKYRRILTELDKLEAPVHLLPTHRLIKQALEEQSQYFKQIDDSKSYRFSAQDAVIQSSHAKLIQAYSLLMALFPNETKHNKTAFYDHLCALDFI